jgi:hypothetical protein
VVFCILAFVPCHVCPHFTLPGIYLASNRNEHQKVFLAVKRGLRLRMTPSPSSVSRLSRQCGIRNISHPNRPPLPFSWKALLYFCTSYQQALFLNHNLFLVFSYRHVFSPLHHIVISFFSLLSFNEYENSENMGGYEVGSGNWNVE